MFGTRFVHLAAPLHGCWLLLLFPFTSNGIHLPLIPKLQGLLTVASPNIHVTEAPSQDLVERNLAKRAFNPCTQWSIYGGGQVGCSGTNTCLFTTYAGYGWEYCGEPNTSPIFATRCYDYPATPVGISPVDVAYCPRSLPYCGEYQFIFQGNTFYNFGCSTISYNFLVETTLGATFPGGSATTTSPSPKPSSTTVVPPSSNTPILIITPTPPTSNTPILMSSPTPITSIIPSSSPASSAAASTTSNNAPSSTSSTAATSISTSSSASTTFKISPTTSNNAPSSTPSAAATSISSASTSATPVPCSDSQWEPTPENWFNADVDHKMAAWWANTTTERGSYGFVDWLARNFGDLSHDQECGIGQSCAAPDCPSFQSSGAPEWVYFVRFSLMEMNNLLNSMNVGMSHAETHLSLIVSDMAANFFPWQNPNTNLNKALPWILAAISSVLSFIPVIGPEISDAIPKNVFTVVTSSAQALTAAGFQMLSTGGSDPVTHQLGTIQDLGVLIANVTGTASDDLETWSTTLFNGDPDSTGKTIIDYMAGGRFTVPYNIPQSFLDKFFLQVWVSKLVNEQWQDKANAPSKTFVMCTNGTAACDESSKYTEGSRTCCLYSIDGNANYVLPPAIEVLGNSTYNITPSDITASSLHSYLAQGLNYDDSKISTTIEQSISDSNNTFLDQGIRFQGVWTLPVCDVGLNGNWVADMSAGEMPCCCGPSCSETIQFWNNTGVLSLQGLHNKCKTQCSTCPTSAANRRYPLMGMDVVDGIYALAMFYVVVLVWASL